MTEMQSLGCDPADDVWRWFTQNGPHGPNFTWSQTRQNPPGYAGVEHLDRNVKEKIDNDPAFLAKIQTIIKAALLSTNLLVLSRAIQVAAVIGRQEDLTQLGVLTKHENESIASDARAALFYLRKKLRSEK
ncbi:MAG: hypothetical protein HOP34_00675 [Methylococcaceae bacterium]|nr:hypothetical protein [Methylococcaceae bacterium]